MGVLMDLLDFGSKLYPKWLLSKQENVQKNVGAQFDSAAAGSAGRAEPF